jgi:hypothetical protein
MNYMIIFILNYKSIKLYFKVTKNPLKKKNQLK